MSLINNYTLEMLSSEALDTAKADPKWGPAIKDLGGCIPTVFYKGYKVPIYTSDIRTSVEISFSSDDCLSAGVDIVGAIPLLSYKKKLRLFQLFTRKTDAAAYTAMYLVCSILCTKIEALVRKNTKILISDYTLEVVKTSSGKLTTVKVRDLLHRENKQFVTSLDGRNGHCEPIPKADLLEFLLLAKEKYFDILTPRKLERLDMLIQEQQGTRPGPREIQKMIREAKEKKAQAGIPSLPEVSHM